MDVENYEFNVLQGAENILKKFKPFIYTELWENENREKCITFLRSMNYKPCVFVNHQLKDYEAGVTQGQNFVFMPI